MSLVVAVVIADSGRVVAGGHRGCQRIGDGGE